jgi:hypothetical protein
MIYVLLLTNNRYPFKCTCQSFAKMVKFKLFLVMFPQRRCELKRDFLVSEVVLSIRLASRLSFVFYNNQQWHVFEQKSL